MKQFVLAEGETHLVNPILSDYTLCGDAFDLGSDEDGYEWQTTKKRVVSCAKCAAIIAECRGVKVEAST